MLSRSGNSPVPAACPSQSLAFPSHTESEIYLICVDCSRCNSPLQLLALSGEEL